MEVCWGLMLEEEEGLLEGVEEVEEVILLDMMFFYLVVCNVLRKEVVDSLCIV